MPVVRLVVRLLKKLPVSGDVRACELCHVLCNCIEPLYCAMSCCVSTAENYNPPEKKRRIFSKSFFFHL